MSHFLKIICEILHLKKIIIDFGSLYSPYKAGSQISKDTQDLGDEEEGEGGGGSGLRGWRVSDGAEIVRFHKRLWCLKWFYVYDEEVR